MRKSNGNRGGGGMSVNGNRSDDGNRNGSEGGSRSVIKSEGERGRGRREIHGLSSELSGLSRKVNDVTRCKQVVGGHNGQTPSDEGHTVCCQCC